MYISSCVHYLPYCINFFICTQSKIYFKKHKLMCMYITWYICSLIQIYIHALYMCTCNFTDHCVHYTYCTCVHVIRIYIKHVSKKYVYLTILYLNCNYIQQIHQVYIWILAQSNWCTYILKKFVHWFMYICTLGIVMHIANI